MSISRDFTYKAVFKGLIIGIAVFAAGSVYPMNRLNRVLGHLVSAPKNDAIHGRPSQVQAAVDKAFEVVKARSIWGCYNGRGRYLLLGIEDIQLLLNLAHETNDKDVYIIDSGCGGGAWGRHAMKVLLSEECKKSGKHFHILSLTGGLECDNLEKKEGHVTLYQINQFKVENIDEELAKRGFKLNNKVDLMVSRWAMRHMVDPLGTLKRKVGLLKPGSGKLLSNGFLFKLDGADDVFGFPRGNAESLGAEAGHESILAGANVTMLFREWDEGRDTGEFLLMRNDAREFQIPLEYTGKIEKIGSNYNCASEVVTVFKGSLCNTKMEYVETVKGYNRLRYYWNSEDQRAKDLYHQILRRQGGKPQDVYWTKYYPASTYEN